MHPQATIAAQAMQAAKRQGKTWEMEEVLFENLRQLSEESILGYAEELGLDMEKFKSDLQSDEITKEVADDLQAGRAAGVRGTPTIMINGMRFRGQRTLEGFKAVIDAELAKANALIDKGTAIEKVYETLSKSE
jgi:predicted DsbA family dithiol-disulfide isomerase